MIKKLLRVTIIKYEKNKTKENFAVFSSERLKLIYVVFVLFIFSIILDGVISRAI